jgi:hypothetical protein
LLPRPLLAPLLERGSVLLTLLASLLASLPPLLRQHGALTLCREPLLSTLLEADLTLSRELD